MTSPVGSPNPDNERQVTLRYGDPIRTVELGGDLRTLHFADGTIRFQHPCKDIGEGRQLVCAPLLQLDNGGHRVAQVEPLTISPSVLCADCGTHGFITDGIWNGC